MALGDLIRLSLSFGVVFVSFDGISLIVLMRKIVFSTVRLCLYWVSWGMGPSSSDSEQAGWIRPGLPPMRMMTGPIQHFRSAIWQAWQSKVAADLCKRKGFRGGFSVEFYGSHQLLVSSHLRERDNMLLRAILSGAVWNGFLLSKAKREGHSL